MQKQELAKEKTISILNDLYSYQKNAEVALAISDYYISFDDSDQAINILENFLTREPINIKILNQLAMLYLMNGDTQKAIEYKFKVYKYYEFNRNRKKQKRQSHGSYL